jgi:glycosyltransferase involved in cell wall biosynthesis
MRERAGIPKDSTVLLYAGRISPEKNIGLLLNVMRELAGDQDRDYRLLIAGAGPQAERLEEQANEMFPGKMIQLGHLDKDTLSNYYANADVFIHPNPKEPFGIAPLEAMASGAPAVAPNSGGILSYATNENAWLVEPAGEAFAAAIREVMDDDELRASKVSRALDTARANTREASTDRLFATYDEMWEDFNARKELFVDIEKSKEFDFVREAISDVENRVVGS